MKKTQKASLTNPVLTAAPNYHWHSLSSAETLEKLDVSQDTGLSSAEVIHRRELYGSNQLAEKPRTGFFRMLLDQLNNFLVILLIVAAGISLFMGDIPEALAIFAIVILNAVLGVVQEGRAEKALAALKKLAAPEALVLRDGHHISVPSHELVPGDMVHLETGHFIPADLRLVETVNMRIDEAALTGESVARQKNAGLKLEDDIPLGDRKNMAFMGTTVTYGRGQGVVTSTGMGTELGKIAGMLQEVEAEETPLQQRLDHLGKLLGWGALGIVSLVFVIGMIRDLSSGGGFVAVKTSFMIAVSLAIAAVPEGLPAVVTISLALGMREMIKRHALIRRLSSVETLGSATVICSDKTGTLTQNEMTITRCWVDGSFFEVTGSGYTPTGDLLLNGNKIQVKDYPALQSALWVGVLNNDADLETNGNDNSNKTTYRIVGDPTEGSILVAAEKAGISPIELRKIYPRVQEIPFDSTTKRMLTVHAMPTLEIGAASWFKPGESTTPYAVAVKGAPDIILNLCTHYMAMDQSIRPLDEASRKLILDANDKMTQNALRVLGAACSSLGQLSPEPTYEALEKDLIFIGLVGMIDPARPEVMPALEHARRAGIRTIMITGDYPNTARAIANDIHLINTGHHILTSKQISEMDDATLAIEVQKTDVFARVSPEHKMRIVDALRSNNEIVAMTGDGVNDAPAIKRANIGIAMGITGTDVAKETADMVLTDDNYASIVSAIEQGRIIYSNIRKFVYYLLSCNLAEIGVIFLATIFGWTSPLTALQLLWLNLVTDGAPAMALATEKGDPDIMDRPPRPPKEPIINKYMQIGIVIQTIAITGVTLIAYFIGKSNPEHHLYAQTMSFATLSISELFRAFTARSEYFPLVKIGIFTNKWMNLAFLSSIILILGAIYLPFLQSAFATEPLGWAQWGAILPLILIPSIAAELTKVVLGRQRK